MLGLFFRSGIRFLSRCPRGEELRVTGSNPVEVLTFSGFYIRSCINCVHNCEDHSLLNIYIYIYIYVIRNELLKAQIFAIDFVSESLGKSNVKRRTVTS